MTIQALKLVPITNVLYIKFKIPILWNKTCFWDLSERLQKKKLFYWQLSYIVIRYVSITWHCIAKFGIFTAAGLNGALVKAEVFGTLECAHFSVPFRPTKVQMPNLALIETKWITTYWILTKRDSVEADVRNLINWGREYRRGRY